MRTLTRSMRTAGFSMVEVMVATTVLVVLGAALSIAMAELSDAKDAALCDASLQDAADRALTSIVTDLRRSGFVTEGGVDYPFLFDDGETDEVAFAEHQHTKAVEYAAAGDQGFGSDREIVFLQPADADADDRPDIDGNGELAWDAREFGYALITQPDGSNALERRIDGATDRIVARWVERIRFENSEDTGFEIPLDAVRVTLDFLRLRKGVSHRHRAEVVVQLRNGEQIE